MVTGRHTRVRRTTESDPRRITSTVSRPVLITGGAPRIAVDAVRYLTVHATGSTAVAMQQRLAERHLACDLLLGAQAVPGTPARRYDSRQDLERELQAWIATNPEGVVVMAAAVNDYEVDQVESIHAGKVMAHGHGGKVPSGADQLVIRLRPAGKVIDNLRAWGLRGPLVAFKYEAAETVVASARSLQRRIGASLVVANSLDGTVQALIDPIRVQACASRDELLAELAVRLVDMAAR